MADLGSQELEQMYQEVILDASRHPHGRGTLTSEGDPAAIGGEATVTAVHESCSAARSHQFNPTCGDEVTVHVEVSDSEPHRIESVVWDGQGCSISQASLSIMVNLVEGKTVDEAHGAVRPVPKLMESRGAGLDDEQAEDALGDAAVFQGVSKYPMRIKCALLGWEGLRDSLAKALASQHSEATEHDEMKED